MSASFDFEAPDHFTAGTVGPPGQRIFYLQAREADELVTLKVEKEQVGGLAEFMAGLLARLPPAEKGAREGKPAEAAALVEPLEAAWAVASLGVGYDEDHDRIVVVANEQADEAEEEPTAEEAETAETVTAETLTEEPLPEESLTEESPAGEGGGEAATARFLITRAQAAAFVTRARELVKAGRPTCPMCGQAMDAAGHVCPRSNGHMVR